MVRVIAILMVIAGVLAFVCNVPTHGQGATTCITNAYCGWYSFSSGCLPPLPAGKTNCSTIGPWTVVCQVVTTSCGVPPSWCPTCQRNQAAASNPINLSNGNTYIQQSDVRIPGLGGGLALLRTWNSLNPPSESGPQSGMFGSQWSSTYEERVYPGSGDAVNYTVYARGDGGRWYFGPNNGSSWPIASPSGPAVTLTQNGTQTWTLTFENGEQRIFSVASGQLTSVVDRNGNTTQLSYDGTNRLVTVTDPASRHLYFAYQSSYSNFLVTTVSSDVGLTLSYSYDTNGRLNQVTKPDLTTVTFNYNPQSLISSVTDMNGKVLESHTYDTKGRGLTSSEANGVNAVTLTYSQ